MEEESIARALNDETRLQILAVLVERGERTIQDLAELVGRHRSTIYKHLVKLEEAGLVSHRERDGRFFYAATELGGSALKVYRGLRGEAALQVRVKRRFWRLPRGMARIFLVVPSAALVLIALKGMATPDVNALSKIIWFTTFTCLALAWWVAVRKHVR